MPEKKPSSLRRKRRTPKWIKRPGQFISRGAWTAPIAAWLGVWYLKLVFHTNRFVVEPEDILDTVKPHLPAIAAVWHGQHILMPVIPIGLKGSVMISKNLDGEITARIAEYFGNKTIRASGGRDQAATLQKGGIRGFLEMLNALQSGESVVQTADVPRGISRKAGLGIITLAQRSGRPIVPLAIASSRRHVFKNSWDRAALNLPFGRSAICAGDLIWVKADADAQELEASRVSLENEMNRVTERAYYLTGAPE